MTEFSRLSTIIPDKTSSWQNKTYLTFDVDWAHDEIIEDCYNLISCYKVPSTWFVTHKFNLLGSFKNDQKIELGIHPNFNNILFEKEKKKSVEIIEEIMSLVPASKSIRSHSLTQNERLVDIFHDFGLSHISNFFIPHSSKIDITPFYLWNKMVVTPHFWQDNVSLKMSLSFPLKDNSLFGFKVFNFHPIHIFLNTNNLDVYENTRSIHHKPKELIKYRERGEGVRSQLISLLDSINSNVYD